MSQERRTSSATIAPGVREASTDEQGILLRAIYGTGRSGTTWLGSLVAAHPDVAYRFEPFHRLSGQARAAEILSSAKRDGAITVNDIRSLEQWLRTPNSLTCKPPFPNVSARRAELQRIAWAAARKLSICEPLFGMMAAPSRSQVIVFKEVGLEWLQEAMAAHRQCRMVYLVRSPHGFVASVLNGQRSGKMPSVRLGMLEALLQDHAPHLLGKVSSSLTDAGRNALLWRLDVERGVRAAERSEDSAVVVYESLCRETRAEIDRVFACLGLAGDSRQINSFLERTTKHQSSRGLFTDSYFTVFRDPAEGIDKWRRTLDAGEISEIEGVVTDSEIVTRYRDSGAWDSP